MAAKKTKARSKAATKSVAKKTTVGKTRMKKTVAKKSAAKTTAKRTASSKKSTTKSRRKASSVDGILKRYQKERVAHEAKLVSVRDQIIKLTTKIQTCQKQIVKLKSQQLDTENSICTLDIRRDQEVAGLLSSLGINLDSIASAGEMAGKKKVDKATPLFDTGQSGGDEKPATASQPDKSTPKVDVLIATKSDH